MMYQNIFNQYFRETFDSIIGPWPSLQIKYVAMEMKRWHDVSEEDFLHLIASGIANKSLSDFRLLQGTRTMDGLKDDKTVKNYRILGHYYSAIARNPEPK